MTVFVLRHGETYANVDKRYFGFSESDLTETGKLQIRKMKEILVDEKFDKVYCSPSGRTKQTAEILGVDYIINENLREMNFGIFERMTYDEIMNKYPKESNEFYSNWGKYKIPKGESFIDVNKRANGFLDSIDKDENILIITHGGWIRAFLSDVLDGKAEHWEVDISTGSLSIIENINNEYKLINVVRGKDNE
ncbi:MAG: histidine phosphatase family protein [Bacillota bacterium]|nr:histidine phosphatase family protein [Bacillota bacterium]